MPTNPAYRPDYYDGENDRSRHRTKEGYRSDDDRSRDKGNPSNYSRRDGYRSDDDRGRDKRSPPRDRRRDGSDDDRERGMRNDGYLSEPDRRRDDRGEHSMHDPRRDRRDDRFYREDDHYAPEHYFYHRGYPSRPQYDPRDYPYYYPSRDHYHPRFPPEREPRLQPYFRYEGDMRRQPFYMYDPMDVYAPRYPIGPHEHYRGPSHYPPRSYQYEYRKKGASGKSGKRKTKVDFQEEVEEQEFDPNEVDPYLIEEIQRSKMKMRLALLIVLVIFLIASVALGAVAAALEPWWVQESTQGGTTYDSIKVGFWRTCHRPNKETAWVCHKYSEKGVYASPYRSITLLQWSMVVGSISAFIALALAFVAIGGRRSRYLMGIIYTTIFFALGATVLFGLVIAYVNEDTKATKIVGSWTKITNASLKTGMMFAIGCAATATSGMSLILCCVFAFIYEPEIKPNVEIVEKVEEEEEEEEAVPVNRTKTKNVENTKRPKRQGTKYVRKDGTTPQLNGHVVHHKQPAVITKDQEDNAKVKVRQPKVREEPRQNGQPGMQTKQPRPNVPSGVQMKQPRKNVQPVGNTKQPQEPRPHVPPGIHTMQPRQNYSHTGIPPKDYGAAKSKQPPPKKLDKQGKGGPPRQPPQYKPVNPVNPTNKNIPPTQYNQTGNPNAAQRTGKQIALYDGDYDKYFNEPY